MKPVRYLCSHCGERFVHWTGKNGAQTHANESKHSRVEMSETKLGETK